MLAKKNWTRQSASSNKATQPSACRSQSPRSHPSITCINKRRLAARRSISDPFILISMRRYRGQALATQRRKLQAITPANGRSSLVGRLGQHDRPTGVIWRHAVPTSRQPPWSSRPQPGRIDCPFVGLGDRPAQIYNPIILANRDDHARHGCSSSGGGLSTAAAAKCVYVKESYNIGLLGLRVPTSSVRIRLLWELVPIHRQWFAPMGRQGKLRV